MTTLEALKKVKHRLRSPNLWCKEDFERGNRCCLSEAIRTSCIDEEGIYQGSVHDVTMAVLKAMPKKYQNSIILFNDDRKTHHSDIIKVLNSAIKEAKIKKNA